MVHDRHWAAGFLQPHARGARAGADALLLVAESGSGLPGLLHGWHGHHLLVPQAARPPLLPYTQVARVRGGVRGGYVCGAGRAHGVGVRPQIPPPAHRDAARPALVVRGLLVVTRRMDARFGDLHGQMRRPQKRGRPGQAALLPPLGGALPRPPRRPLRAHRRRRGAGGRAGRGGGGAVLAMGGRGAAIPRHLVRQLGRPLVGQPALPHGRPVAQQLVGRIPSLWRRVAQ
mmetsp:Transcript_24972/g.80678  ORF Transcript_24972/g.80678 Transcript_24972/m.80678 type:complete len:230 (+) Transcript_24972:412-1101(+)